MKHFGGWYFPDRETHLIDWLKKAGTEVDGKLQYQGKKLDAALAHVKQFRTAIDIGAHVGLWSFYLQKRFETVVAFEPVEEHRLCFARNVPRERVLMFPVAVGETSGKVAIHTAQSSSGDSWVSGDGDIDMVALDKVALLETEQVDFLKADCEGYELFALRGAEQLLRRCRPVVIVEQKPGRAQKFGLPETGAVDFLRDLGAKLRAEISGDFILSWD